MDRPQLLGRTFDRTYIVKYLGIDTFTGYDLVSMPGASRVARTNAKVAPR